MHSLTVLSFGSTRLQTKNLATGDTYAKTSRVRKTHETPFETLKQLKKKLSELQHEPNSCVIRGKLKQGVEGRLRRRKTHFEDAPCSWVMLDIDDVKLPKRLRTTPYTEEHARIAIAQLPVEFQGVACVWQASASAGVKASRLKLHLWYLLDKPLTAAQLREWLKGVDVVDPATLRCVQPHYTAAPLGAEGIYEGKRLGLVRGALQEVPVPKLSGAAAAADSVEMTPRPKGSADVSKQRAAAAMKQAEKRCVNVVNSSTVAYNDAYTAGTILGSAVAFQTWGDREHGHESWKPVCASLASQWGHSFAALDGTNNPPETYVQRVAQGIEWGVARERERLGKRSAKVVEQTLANTRELRERLVRRMQANRGSEQTLREVGRQLGRFASDMDVDELRYALQEASGLSPKQVDDALEQPEVAEIEADEWRDGLVMTGKNLDEIAGFDVNVVHIFRNHPEFKRSFRYNVRANVLVANEDNVLGLEPGVVDADKLPALLMMWLASIGCTRPSLSVVKSVFAASVHNMPQFDPFLEEFPEALWSEEDAKAELERIKPRLDGWLEKYLDAEGEPEYLAAVGSKALIAAVARAVNPGAKVDAMLVLVGAQGIGKSSVVSTLANVIPSGYSEVLDMRDKDAILIMQAGLVVEMSELRALRASQEEHTKAFITRTHDRVRAPYAVKAQELPRRMVFVGTTNDDEFLTDNANRRFWPVRSRLEQESSKPMSPGVARKLWREAALRFAAGEQWWLEGNAKQLQQDAVKARRVTNLVEEMLESWLEGKKSVKFLDACKAVAGDGDPMRVQYKVSAAMKFLGWRLKRTSKARMWVTPSRQMRKHLENKRER